MTGDPAIRSVHLVADTMGATQAISFLKPLAGAVPVSFADCGKGATDPASLLPERVPDVLVLSRLTSALGRPLIDWARERDVPVIFHLDDDLLDVPDSLGPRKTAHYRSAALQAHLRDNIEGSDLVYASTGPLAERLRHHGIERPIVAGDIYCSVDPARVGPGLPSALPVLGYMGTGGHEADLDLALPAIARLLDWRPTLRFELFGTIASPPELARFGDRVRHHPPLRDYGAFLARLKALGWWVGIAPLADQPFNRCKADTKWVEYSLAGIAVVAQDLPVYHRACAGGAGLLAATGPDWESGLAALLDDRRLRESTIRSAQEKLRTTYSHAALREQVLGVFKQARAARPSLRRAG